MYIQTAFLLLLAFQLSNCAELSSVLTSEDGKRLLQYFKAPFKDLETAYYGIESLKHYTQGGAIGSPEQKSACALAKACDPKSLQSLYHAATIVHQLGASCKHTFSKESVDFVKGFIKENAAPQSLILALQIMFYTGNKVDSTLATNGLLNAMKEDNSVLGTSLVLQAASTLPKANVATILKSADIEDMAAQADEVDGRYLHFENDMQTSFVFLSAVFSVSKSTNQAPLLSPDQIILFSNFILRSKSSVFSAKEAASILISLGKIAASPHLTLAKADVTSGSSISEENSKIAVSISNVFGQPLTELSVKVETVSRTSDDEVVMSNTPLKFDGVRTYSVAMWKAGLKSGFYDIALAVSSSGSKLIGVSELQFRVKVTTKISLINVQLGTAERESAGGSLKKIDFLKKAGQLKADNLQKVVMKFQVQDLTDKSLLSPHQAFVRFLHEKSGQEVIFVAEPDKDLTFKFEVDLGTGGREQFNSVSGKYSMHLIVGDVSIANPVFWNFGDIVLQLGGEAENQKTFEAQYAPKPEIHHLFRQPEKRPPVVVSQAFTIACLIPILILFILWFRIGANIRDFRFSLKNIIFHAGLGGIFFLYYMFWTKWNMFTTLQYLCAVGAVTFVCGNSVLSELANQR